MSVGLDGANEERENMSGGSMNYLYCKLENDADFKQTTPERKAFALHLVKVAKALHDIESVSYTHLDVYKRQHKGRGLVPNRRLLNGKHSSSRKR